jgi:hypothetical protein
MMTKRIVLSGILALALLGAPGRVLAHDGHVHTVRGVVTLLGDTQVEVKGEDGKTVRVTLDAKTSVLRGTQKADRKAMQVGQRVVVDVGNGKTPLVARSIKLGVVEAKK